MGERVDFKWDAKKRDGMCLEPCESRQDHARATLTADPLLWERADPHSTQRRPQPSCPGRALLSPLAHAVPRCQEDENAVG